MSDPLKNHLRHEQGATDHTIFYQLYKEATVLEFIGYKNSYFLELNGNLCKQD